MRVLIFFYVCTNLLLYVNLQVYECPNYELLNQPRYGKIKKPSNKVPRSCNLAMINPKKVINPYKKEIQNYVPSKPFGSICVMCSMCLAIAKELDKIFREIVETNTKNKQSAVVDLLTKNIKDLCEHDFESYDLRKYKQFQEVTNDFTCNTHVRTKMDGRWTEKLREMCTTYLNYMDIQYLLNMYLKGTENLGNYLCRYAMYKII